jgi:MFS family permease
MNRADGADTRNKHSILGAIAAGNFVQLGSRLLVGAVVPLVLTYFETSRSRIGLALTFMWVLYAVLQFPSGMLSDRYGERRLVVFALGVQCLGILLIALAPSVAFFGLSLLVLGAGGGLFLSPALSLVSRLYTNNGSALSIVTAAGGVAGVLFPIVGGFVGLQAVYRQKATVFVRLDVVVADRGREIP